MNVPKISVIKIGCSCLKAILLNGQETIWGRDEKEPAGRLKRRLEGVAVQPRYIEQALDIRG